MTYRAMTQKSDLPECMYLPRFLNEIPCSSSSKLLYCFLLDNTRTKGIKDDRGQVYVRFSIAELSDFLMRRDSSTKRLLHELESFGLIQRRRKYIGLPPRLYVFIPEQEETQNTLSGVHLDHTQNAYA